jgi:hypothetical protein
MSKNIHTVTAKYKDPNKIESSAIWTRASQVTNSMDYLLIVVFNYLCTTILGNIWGGVGAGGLLYYLII